MVGTDLSMLLYIKALLRKAFRLSKRVSLHCRSSAQKAPGRGLVPGSDNRGPAPGLGWDTGQRVEKKKEVRNN